jgi:hypothetical protein|tara:strand:+ start:4216 stop:4755 length:540 start_codon:yes stop_codon:yes gene_type:complete
MKKIFLYVVVLLVVCSQITRLWDFLTLDEEQEVKNLIENVEKLNASTDLNYVRETSLDYLEIVEDNLDWFKKEQSDSLILVLKNLKIKFSEEELIEKQFHPWDASHIKLESYIKKNLMKDPESYEHVETGYTLENGSLYVQTKIRGNNSFGGKSRMKVFAKCNKENGEIIEIISVDDNY